MVSDGAGLSPKNQALGHSYPQGTERIHYTYNTVSSGIQFYKSSNIIIENNEVVLGCNDANQEQITVSGVTNFEIRYNKVHDGGPGTYGGEAIDAKGNSAYGKIYGNQVYRNKRLGIYVDAYSSYAHDIEVYNNIVYENAQNGISVGSEKGGLLENVKIYNNITYRNRWSGILVSGWAEPGYTSPLSNVSIINNTSYKNGWENFGAGIYVENVYIKNLIIRNNILSQNAYAQIALKPNVPVQQITADRNLIDTAMPIKTWDGEIVGNNSLIAPALFLNASKFDFHLQASSPAIGAGTSNSAPPYDFEGVDRLADGKISIGAFEGSGNVTKPLANLIANAGFENGNIVPWAKWGSFTAVNYNAFHGAWCGKVGPYSGGGLMIESAPYTTYTLSGFGVVTAGQWAALGFVFIDSNGAKIGSEVYANRFTTNYDQRVVTFTTLANVARVQIIVWNANGGDFYMDDLMLTKN